jgi:pyridoxamine 5'-phosphate oxidase
MDERELDDDPLIQFRAWLSEAEAATPQANAMTLATAAMDGSPSARQVLLQGLDERGLAFYTNGQSRKGEELAQNPRAALVFHWYELGRQVRVEGRVDPVDDRESDEYWRLRPRASQLAAWASPQSEPLESRAALEELYDASRERFGAGAVPRPRFWGGYRVIPDTMEFWQHREDRLHDRVRYVRDGAEWRRERLAP